MVAELKSEDDEDDCKSGTHHANETTNSAGGTSIWTMSQGEYLGSDNPIFSRESDNVLYYRRKIMESVAEGQPVPEEIVKAVGTVLGVDVYQMWQDFKDPETAVVKYGRKPPSMSVKEYAGILKNLPKDGPSIKVNERFIGDEYREFLNQFTPDEFSDLILKTECASYTPSNYSIYAYPGLTFTGDHSKISGIYVCVGPDKPEVDGARLIEGSGDSDEINFLFFEDDRQAVMFYQEFWLGKRFKSRTSPISNRF
jgi:hypothetical protein